ncbi:MAG TPA: encapsulin-associated ferritin-like protein [Anaeromyxobacteraceae bacterium]|nr:encapsulin-associated ferritin-like protein [Anaeromyxobacteraceae bacterium]
MANSAGYHEPFERLSPRTIDMHRALASLQEELEAIDWYQQRIDVTEDAELRDILEHNRDEEKEHAAMVLEWIRRHDEAFARQLAHKLNRPGRIAAEEEKQEAAGDPKSPPPGRGEK